MLTVVLLLSFVAAAARYAPDTWAGGWCRRLVAKLAERTGEMTMLKVVFTALGLMAFVCLAYSLPAEIAWLLSLDVASVLEVMASAALAASILRMRRVRLKVTRVLTQAVRATSRVIRAGRTRRNVRPRRAEPPSSDGEPEPAWAFA